jgi:hypothetical protein
MDAHQIDLEDNSDEGEGQFFKSEPGKHSAGHLALAHLKREPKESKLSNDEKNKLINNPFHETLSKHGFKPNFKGIKSDSGYLHYNHLKGSSVVAFNSKLGKPFASHLSTNKDVAQGIYTISKNPNDLNSFLKKHYSN